MSRIWREVSAACGRAISSSRGKRGLGAAIEIGDSTPLVLAAIVLPGGRKMGVLRLLFAALMIGAVPAAGAPLIYLDKPPIPRTTIPQPVQGCCKTCSKGKACGDSCISREKTCRKGQGCACDG